MSAPTRVLVIVDAHVGHLHATLGLTAALVEHGAQVTYSGPAEAAPAARAAGFEFVALRGVDLNHPEPPGLPVRKTGCLARRMSAHRRMKSTVGSIRAEIGVLIRTTNPDLVLVDPFLLMFYPFLWAEGVVVVALSTKPLFRRSEVTPPYTSSLVPKPTRWGKIRVQLGWVRQWAGYLSYRFRAGAAGAWRGWSVRRLMVAAAREVAFPWHDEFVVRPLPFDVRFRSVPELVLSSPEFDFDANYAVPGVIYAGPCVSLVRRESAFDWSWLAAGQRLVYFSMGTVARRLDKTAVRLAWELANAFADDPDWAVLLAIPDERAVAVLGEVSANVRAVTWAPQLASLRRASVAVTHGGHNSVKECLLLEVPMVVYPRAADQFGNSARVLFHGVGLRGRARQAGREEIRRAVEWVAGDGTMRAKLGELGATLRNEARTECAVRELMLMAKPPHPSSTSVTAAGNSPART